MFGRRSSFSLNRSHPRAVAAPPASLKLRQAVASCAVRTSVCAAAPTEALQQALQETVLRASLLARKDDIPCGHQQVEYPPPHPLGCSVVGAAVVVATGVVDQLIIGPAAQQRPLWVTAQLSTDRSL